MISVIMPLVQRQRPFFWLARGLVYIAASTASAAVVGALVALLGLGLRAILPLPVLLGAAILLAVAYGLHETGLWRLPQPERAWQVPNEWIRRWPILGAAFFGLTIGAGVFTYIPFTSFYLLLAWEGLTANPATGALLGGAYGLARGLPVLTGAWTTWRGSSIVPVHVNLLAAQRQIHRATAGLLLLCALALIFPLLLGR